MNRNRVLTAVATAAMTVALVVGVSTPASAAVKSYWTGTLSCGANKMPVVSLYARSGTVDIIRGRKGDTLPIKNTTKVQNFRPPIGTKTIEWIVNSTTLVKAPTVTCVVAPV